VIGSRCLATDLAIELPIEHGPQSTLLAHFNPVMYGSPAQTMTGILRVLTDPDRFAFSRSIGWHGTHVSASPWSPLVAS
jgi:hypothetical protein